MTQTLTFVHRPGYSRIDHVAAELISMAEQEMEGRPKTRRSMEAALTRASLRAKKLAKDQPAGFGVFRFTLPRIDVEAQ